MLHTLQVMLLKQCHLKGADSEYWSKAREARMSCHGTPKPDKDTN